MNEIELIYLPVKSVVADNAHLALWTTDAHKPFAYDVMEAWGFKFKCEAVWVKTNDIETTLYRTEDGTIKFNHQLTTHEVKLQIGMGNYFRHAHETVLFGTRGKAPPRIKNVPSVFFAPRLEHSVKPAIFHSILEQMSNAPGLELFARRQRPGWTCWGNELVTPVTISAEVVKVEFTHEGQGVAL